MESEYLEMVASFVALQLDYEKIGFVDTPVYARACRALDWAEKNQSQMVELIRAGEGIQDWQENTGRND